MKLPFLPSLASSAVLLASNVSPVAGAPLHAWSYGFGDTQGQQGHSVAIDLNGNVIVAGTFDQTLNLGGSDLASEGSADIFVAKFNPNGIHQWSQRFGDWEPQTRAAVAVDENGNVILGGWFRGTVNFGGSSLVSSGGFDAFLAKFDPAGVHQWSQHFGDASDQFGYSVATDENGSAILTGWFSGTMNFGGEDLVGGGGDDIFVAKFDASGVHQWSHGFGALGGQHGNSIATDGDENVILTGYFNGSVDFGGGTLVSAGTTDAYLAKFNSAGVHQWSKRFGNNVGQSGNAVATDQSGNILMTGDFVGSINFGGSDLVTAGTWDIFVAKFNAAGTHVWSKRFGDEYVQENTSVATDAQGNVILTGQFHGDVDFGGGVLSSAGDHELGRHDVYVVKLSSSGGYHMWSRRFGDELIQHSLSVATGVDGGLALTGRYDGAINFGGLTLYPFDNDFYSDLFLVRFVEPVTPVTDPSFPSDLSLMAFPNPFNPTTTLRYTLTSSGHTTVAIYDAVGVCVTTLVDEDKPAGVFTAEWNGRNRDGGGVNSGVYFARITHASGTKSYKLVLLK